MRIDKPLTKEQAKQGDLIPPGIYTYEVMDATDEISKSSGREMIKLKLKIFMPDGRERILFDYLTMALEYKIAHFCESAGLWDKYQAGEITADDCFQRSGQLKINIQKDKNGAHPDKSGVQDYLLSDEAVVAKVQRKVASAPAGESFEDDGIPF